MSLTDLYFLIRPYPGWLAGAAASLALAPEDITALEEMDDAYGLPLDTALAEWDKETEGERRLGIFGLDTDAERVAVLSQTIAEAYRDYAAAVKADGPYLDRVFLLVCRDVEELEKLRRTYRGRTVHRAVHSDDDRISDADIVAAREYPLERLLAVELTKFGYVKCRWHDDKKPSMLVKKGYGWCFSCSTWADSIKWLVEVDQMSFADAVRYLRAR